MKHTITILASLIIATAAQAQNHHIDTPEGRVILEQAPCEKTGKQATFIESRSGGGGAYGCWFIWNDRVYVAWTQLIGANGSILRTEHITNYPAPNAVLK